MAKYRKADTFFSSPGVVGLDPTALDGESASAEAALAKKKKPQKKGVEEMLEELRAENAAVKAQLKMHCMADGRRLTPPLRPGPRARMRSPARQCGWCGQAVARRLPRQLCIRRITWAAPRQHRLMKTDNALLFVWWMRQPQEAVFRRLSNCYTATQTALKAAPQRSGPPSAWLRHKVLVLGGYQLCRSCCMMIRLVSVALRLRMPCAGASGQRSHGHPRKWRERLRYSCPRWNLTKPAERRIVYFCCS